tara:strand:- start:2858 stop:3202 length:345 start_codon:yes stop_codon:yes gene_type:complete
MKDLPDILKVRFTLELRDCDSVILKKENKSVMLIMSDYNQWNCLSFTACGKNYSMQIKTDGNRYILQLGMVDPPGFFHEAFRFVQGGIKGKYKPSEDSECVNDNMSLIYNISVK